MNLKAEPNQKHKIMESENKDLEVKENAEGVGEKAPEAAPEAPKEEAKPEDNGSEGPKEEAGQ